MTAKGIAAHQATGVLSSGLIILLDRWLVDLDALGLNHGSDLMKRKTR